MPTPPRSEREVRRSLAAVVAWRWPRERVLLTTGCDVERLASRAEWFLAMLGLAHCLGGACTIDTINRHEQGYVGATARRLVYQERARHGMFLRITSLFLVGVALVTLLLVRDLQAPLILVSLAAVAWIGGGLARVLGVGSGHVEFDRIGRVDRRAQVLEGLGRWGTRYRVRIADPSDFGFIATLVERGGAAA